jgi:hypothetical protein
MKQVTDNQKGLRNLWKKFIHYAHEFTAVVGAMSAIVVLFVAIADPWSSISDLRNRIAAFFQTPVHIEILEPKHLDRVPGTFYVRGRVNDLSRCRYIYIFLKPESQKVWICSEMVQVQGSRNWSASVSSDQKNPVNAADVIVRGSDWPNLYRVNPPLKLEVPPTYGYVGEKDVTVHISRE